MTPLLNRLGLYRTFIIAWFVTTALSRFFSSATLSTEEETAITLELDTQLAAEDLI